MNEPSSTDDWQPSSHQVLIAWFPSTSEAEVAVAELAEQGVSEQEFSLLNLDGSLSESKEHGDALEYVLSPIEGGQNNLIDDTEGAADRESEVGAGIATTSPDDDVSAPQEMDDSESAAQDMSYPANDQSFADQEDHDVKEAAETGYYETTRPSSDPERYADSLVDRLDVPGIGVLLGEGSFGDIIMERAFKDEYPDMSWLVDLLNRSSATPLSIEDRGSILAIDIGATSPTLDQIDETMIRCGAAWTCPLPPTSDA